MPSAWFGPQTNQCRQTRPFTGPWESCDSIRQEHALVFSNSVIEHVGPPPKQAEFAHEVLRLGRSYWVQTPSKWFPIEASASRNPTCCIGAENQQNGGALVKNKKPVS